MRPSQLNSSWFPGLLIILLIAALSIPEKEDSVERIRNRSIVHNGQERSYVVFAPEVDFAVEKKPLLIALHGGGGTARSIVRLTGGRLNELAEINGFVVVYPEAVKKYWNEGRKKPVSYAHQVNVDDVGFIKALIEVTKSEFHIDESRIFVTGMANGGLMAYRLACEMPDVFRAIAPVNASLPVDILDTCDNIHGTSLLVMNGTDDPVVPYDGGAIRSGRRKMGKVLSTDATIAHWLELNDCPAHARQTIMPDIDPRDGTSVTRYEYGGCPSDVRIMLYQIDGGGHTWPGGRQYLKEDRVGRTSHDIEGSEAIWEFFLQF